MVSAKLFTVLLLTIVVVTHGIPTSGKNTEIVPKRDSPRERRSVVIPAIGLMFKAWQVATFLLSKSWFVVGLKLTTLAVAAKAVVWIIQHCLSLIIGAAVTFGFCKLTGLCSPPSLEIVAESQHPYELLDTAESYLRKGARKFE